MTRIKHLEFQMAEVQAILANVGLELAELKRDIEELKKSSPDAEARQAVNNMEKRWNEALDSVLNFNPLRGKHES